MNNLRVKIVEKKSKSKKPQDIASSLIEKDNALPLIYYKYNDKDIYIGDTFFDSVNNRIYIASVIKHLDESRGIKGFGFFVYEYNEEPSVYLKGIVTLKQLQEQFGSLEKCDFIGNLVTKSNILLIVEYHLFNELGLSQPLIKAIHDKLKNLRDLRYKNQIFSTNFKNILIQLDTNREVDIYDIDVKELSEILSNHQYDFVLYHHLKYVRQEYAFNKITIMNESDILKVKNNSIITVKPEIHDVILNSLHFDENKLLTSKQIETRNKLTNLSSIYVFINELGELLTIDKNHNTLDLWRDEVLVHPIHCVTVNEYNDNKTFYKELLKFI